jgi:DNA topoisomerase I
MKKGINAGILPELNNGSAMVAKNIGLVYISDQGHGITRKRNGAGFKYLKPSGELIDKAELLIRIKSLAIPPAWKNVWISPLENSHLQATGFDSRGRKQYKYHPAWNETRSQTKYDRMIAFGEKLPLIRERIKKDLQRRGLPKEKVLAIVVELLNRTFLRIGNTEYERSNKTFGLSTLRNRHVRIKKDEIQFNFIAKSGKVSIISLKDKLLASLVKKCRDLPGYHLFSYINEYGERKEIGSNEVNHYLKEISGEDFTSKDFRTWGGTVNALKYFLSNSLKKMNNKKSEIINCVKHVANILKNTVNICKKYYIHPKVLDWYNNLSTENFFYRNLRTTDCLSREEKLVLQILKQG